MAGIRTTELIDEGNRQKHGFLDESNRQKWDFLDEAYGYFTDIIALFKNAYANKERINNCVDYVWDELPDSLPEHFLIRSDLTNINGLNSFRNILSKFFDGHVYDSSKTVSGLTINSKLFWTCMYIKADKEQRNFISDGDNVYRITSVVRSCGYHEYSFDIEEFVPVNENKQLSMILEHLLELKVDLEETKKTLNDNEIKYKEKLEFLEAELNRLRLNQSEKN